MAACRICSAEIRTGARFCWRCGCTLDPTTSGTPIPNTAGRPQADAAPAKAAADHTAQRSPAALTAGGDVIGSLGPATDSVAALSPRGEATSIIAAGAALRAEELPWWRADRARPGPPTEPEGRCATPTPSTQSRSGVDASASPAKNRNAQAAVAVPWRDELPRRPANSMAGAAAPLDQPGARRILGRRTTAVWILAVAVAALGFVVATGVRSPVDQQFALAAHDDAASTDRSATSSGHDDHGHSSAQDAAATMLPATEDGGAAAASMGAAGGSGSGITAPTHPPAAAASAGPGPRSRPRPATVKSGAIRETVEPIVVESPPRPEIVAAAAPAPVAPTPCAGLRGLELQQCQACGGIGALRRYDCELRVQETFCRGQWGSVPGCLREPTDAHHGG